MVHTPAIIPTCTESGSGAFDDDDDDDDNQLVIDETPASDSEVTESLLDKSPGGLIYITWIMHQQVVVFCKTSPRHSTPMIGSFSFSGVLDNISEQEK